MKRVKPKRGKGTARMWTLPDRTTTTSAKKYCDQWRAVNRKLEAALGRKGAFVYGFDPGFAIRFDDANPIDMPLWLGERIVELADAARRLERK